MKTLYIAILSALVLLGCAKSSGSGSDAGSNTAGGGTGGGSTPTCVIGTNTINNCKVN